MKPMDASTIEDQFTSAYATASALLMMANPITIEALERSVAQVGEIPQFRNVDLRRLRRELEANNNIRVGGYTVIDDKEFRAWIQAARDARPFEFWDRYRRWLSQSKRQPRNVVEQTDRLTDDILDRLRDPETPGAWDRRGLVVGDVQSGKTSNYVALVCKAVDAGFRLVIVLAGIHNSLRSQTQLRLDEGFLGFDTRFGLRGDQENQRVGAGGMPGARLLVANSLTSRGDDGDFRIGTPRSTKIVPGGKDPLILVVKKRVGILENVIKWVTSVRGMNDASTPGGKIVRDIPLLLIDDEADNASANTNEYRDEDGNIDEDANPTRTNELIRKLLVTFEKSAYVGYTATPFANVFMHHEAYSNVVGEDLFPRSFIINIPAPSNYIGPEKVFGLARPGSDTESRALPIVRPINDAAITFPPKHKKELQVSSLPGSLREAMLAFVLACAARRVRGDVETHNSMLIHVTRLTMVQRQVARLVSEELSDIRRQLEFEGTGGDASTLLMKLWKDDFDANSDAIRKALPDEDFPPIQWRDVRKQLFDAVRRITVREINGSAKDALDYADNPKGLSVIAIGGGQILPGSTL